MSDGWQKLFEEAGYTGTLWPAPLAPSRPLSNIKDQHVSDQIAQINAQVVNVPTAASSVPAGAPASIVSVSATESPTKVQGKTVSLVSVTFDYDTTDTKYAQTRIWVTGYKGNVNPVLVADGQTSPISFLLETTKETIIVTAQSEGVDGTPSDFASSPTCAVALDGVVSAPPAPSISQLLLSTPTGYQFAFNQLSGLVADVVDSYRVYRNTTNNSGAATLLRTLKHDPTSAGAIVVSDQAQYGEIFYYWVTAVNTSGLESTKTAAQSGTVVGHSANAQLLANSAIVADGSGAGGAASGKLTSSPYVTADWKAGNTVTFPLAMAFDVYFDGAAQHVGEVLLWASDTGSNPNGYMFRIDGRSGQPIAGIYKLVAGVGTNIDNFQLPNLAADLKQGWYRCRVELFKDTGLMNMYVNGVWAASAMDATYSPTGATYYGVDAGWNKLTFAPGDGLLTSLANGYSTRSSPLVGQGSIATVAQDMFSYSSTTTSVTWTWTAFSIFAPDGSVYNIAANPTGVTFSSLSASTTYHFYMYVTLATLAVTVAKSSQSSGTAAELGQVIIQVAQGDGNVAIRPDATAATPASGSGGGSGGGGGTGCFTGAVSVKTTSGFVRFDELPKDRVFKIINETGTHKAKLIVHPDYTDWMIPLGGDKMVTPNHMMKIGEGWGPACDRYKTNERVLHKGPVYNLSILSDDPDDQHYVLWNGDVAHNIKTYQY